MTKPKRTLKDFFDTSYKICSNCGQKKVGSNNAWFQDFTNQPILCKKCINDYTKNIKKEVKND